MSRKSFSIADYMSPTIHSVGRGQSLATAHDLMNSNRIRQLPVLDGGKLVGIITLRDLHLVETLPDVDPEKVAVEDAMTAEVYSVKKTDSLRDVATHMAENKLGCAVVLERGKVMGVFTTVDALRALCDALPA
jgi:acetoin utilization protein AcuB